MRISFTTNNTIKKRLTMKPHNPQTQSQYEKIGVYQLTCPGCKNKYIGQTDRSFYKSFQEHFHDFKYKKYKPKFAANLLENQHSKGPINEIMAVLYTTSKGSLMDTIEKFYIYDETRKNNQIYDKNTVKPNAIFDVNKFARFPTERSLISIQTPPRQQSVTYRRYIHTQTQNSTNIKRKYHGNLTPKYFLELQFLTLTLLYILQQLKFPTTIIYCRFNADRHN